MVKRFLTFMKFAENFIYIFVAINLIGAAIFLLFWAVWMFFSNIDQSPHSNIPAFLDSLLLVLMIVEILYTVGIFLKDRKLVIEPFLAVGVIAAIRRILIITAEQPIPSAANEVAFRLTMIELGLLTFLILSLVAAIFLLRKQQFRTNGQVPQENGTDQ